MKYFKNPIVWLPLIIAVSVAAGILVGVELNGHRNISAAHQKFSDILNLIHNEYVDDVNLDSIIETTLPDLISNLDPHSVYIPASELQAVNADLDGSFSGIGISFTMFTDTATVNEVIPGGPSEKAGLLPGDRIVTVDDSLVAGVEFPDRNLVKMLRGDKGTTVKLGVKRSTSKKLLNFEVIRGDIPVNTVDAAYMISDDTGFIKVNKFGRTTYDEFLTGMTKLMNQGAKSFIVDLRGNTGGFMEMAILMANEFLPARSPIVYTRGRNEMDNSSVFSDGTGSFRDAELVVLLDEYSASASEIFAGAIQDNDRGLVIGRRSFGKGLVQNQMELPDSSAIRLTIARYYTPSGRCIQKTYAPGTDYDRDIINRYEHGEFYSADSIKLDKSLAFETLHGRTVYGGGGIMPDIFVPNDTAGITSYYLNVVNAGLIQKYTFDYTDRNRDRLEKTKDVATLLRMLPDDDTLLQDFVSYSQKAGVAPRWYYINISRDLIVNQLKAMIARNALGVEGYFKVFNELDPTVVSGVEALRTGKAAFPVKTLK